MTEKPGRTTINGEEYIGDGRGGLIPVRLAKPQHLLEDEAVRKIMGYAEELSAQVSRFKEHTYDDIGDFDALLDQEYNAKKGGAKGNKTLVSHDGLLKVEVRVQDYLNFGPELQTAKRLIDEYLNERSADSPPEIRMLVTRAFNTDKEGQINRSQIFMLLRTDIQDPRWQEAMRAINDAKRVVAAKTYVRFAKRESVEDGWDYVTIDIAKA